MSGRIDQISDRTVSVESLNEQDQGIAFGHIWTIITDGLSAIADFFLSIFAALLPSAEDKQIAKMRQITDLRAERTQLLDRATELLNKTVLTPEEFNECKSLINSLKNNDRKILGIKTLFHSKVGELEKFIEPEIKANKWLVQAKETLANLKKMQTKKEGPKADTLPLLGTLIMELETLNKKVKLLPLSQEIQETVAELKAASAKMSVEFSSYSTH